MRVCVCGGVCACVCVCAALNSNSIEIKHATAIELHNELTETTINAPVCVGVWQLCARVCVHVCVCAVCVVYVS